MSFRLQVPRSLYGEMVQHALDELPNECVGLLAGVFPSGGGSAARVLKCYRLVNAAASPTEYLSDPRSMFDAVRDMRACGIEILAIYHSHPTSEPVPSRKDRERNYSPQVMNVIISLAGSEPEVRAWWLTSDDHREAEWEVVAGDPM